MKTAGPTNARVMIVGEAPDERGSIFSFSADQELTRLLHEAKIGLHECFLTNVCASAPPGNDMGEWLVDLKYPPKPENKNYRNKQWVSWKGRWCHPQVVAGYESLCRHIELIKPDLIIALGNTALFALTGKWGIKSWRGSQLTGTVGSHSFKCIPTYHPSAILRDWATRGLAVTDLRRACREIRRGPLPYNVPKYERILRPNFTQVSRWLTDLRKRLNGGPTVVSTDIETRAGHIACIGMYVKGMPTICIPLMCVERFEGYWTEPEERWIWAELRELMTHPNFKIVGQNWGYDSQYFFRFFFVKLPVFWDTMITHHCMYPGQPKGLDVLASLYCEHYVYWKDDGKNWDPKIGEDQLWTYNCEDCERTYEVYEGQRPIVEADERLSRVWNFQTNTLAPLLFKAMCRGIRANVRDKARISAELDGEIKVREKWIQDVSGHPLNIKSPKQMQQFFYQDLRQKPVINRKTGTYTTNDEALSTIAKREPLLRNVCRVVQELRSIGVFKSTFVEARLDRDQRIRCSFNIGGTITFRLSSSENAFGSGLNLQNIPKGNDDPDPGELELPNIRKLFIPDDGQAIFDVDLRNADFYTVVWECDDDAWRLALEAGVDQHLFNAGMLFSSAAECTLERLKDREFVEYAKKKYGKERDFGKRWCHGTNFGGGDRTMAATVGITVRENEKLREKWFYEHPGLKKWHERVWEQVQRHRYVENRFGYRYYFFDRIEGALPEAIAWVPQSTTGCVINRAWDQIDRNLKEAEVLIQVHDSLVGQFDARLKDRMLTEIPEACKVTVPYDRPLVIPVGIKVSEHSWGHCG